MLVGAEATLAQVPKSKAERHRGGQPISTRRSNASPRRATKRVVILASGDPLFYGVARYLCDRLGKDRFEVVPHVSSMQLAFARVKESWEEAYLTEPGEPAARAGRRKDSRRPRRSACSPATSIRPTAVARALLDRADRLLLGLRLRKPRLARRARHAGRAGRNRRIRISPRST